MAKSSLLHNVSAMTIVLTFLAVVFVILGFGGFALGGIPTIVFWVLAGLCIAGAWSARSIRQRRRENRNLPPPGTP